MSFLSFLRRLGARRPRPSRPSRSQRPVRRAPMLAVEPLESRELLAADTPTILATNVTPANSTHPTIQVVFSESMVLTDLQNASNYLLLDSSGNSVPIQLVTAGTTHSINDTATLSYNNGSLLNAGTYSLFVRGDQLHDFDDNRTVAPPGELILANGGRNTVSMVTVPGDMTLGATAQFDLRQAGAPTPSPVSVQLADLDGDGLKDLVVVDSGTNQVEIFRARPPLNGGGFSATPDLTLALPTGAAPAAGSLVVADLHDAAPANNGLLDIAVANAGTNNVSVFLNQRSSSALGQLKFAPPTNYPVAATAVNPVALVAADFNSDGYLDLATADNAQNNGSYVVSFLLNKGGPAPGTFGNPGLLSVGTAAPSGLTNPTDLAAGVLSGSGLTDLVVSGGNGNIAYLQNATLPGATTLSFLAPTYMATGGLTTTSVAIGQISGSLNNDVVATSSQGGGRILLFTNSGGATPAFTLARNLAAGVPSPTAITVSDVDGSGTSDLLYVNNAAAGDVVARLNLTNGGPITFAAPVLYSVDSNPTALALDTATGRPGLLVSANQGGGDVSVLADTGTTGNFSAGGITDASQTPGGTTITVTSPGHGLADGSRVIIRGVQGDTAANGAWTISVVDADHFILNNSTANGVYSGGGYWVSPDDLFRASVDVNLTGINPSPDAVAFGDLNNDGQMDYVVAERLQAQVAVFLSTGATDATGRPLYRSPLYFSVGSQPNSVAIGDVNHDGFADIVVACQLDNVVTVLVNVGSGLSQPDGTSYAPTALAVGPGPTQVVLADVNKDGYADLVVSHNRSSASGDQGVSVILNGAVAGSTAPFANRPVAEYAAGFPASAVAVGDFNGDGNPDLVVGGDSAPGQIRLLLGNGAGGFSDGGTFATGVTNISSIGVGDMNDDGFADVVVASKSTGATTGGVAVLLNQAGTGFAPPVVTPVAPGTGLASVAVTRLITSFAEAFPDVVVSTLSGSAANVYVLGGNGDGTFTASVAYQVGGSGAPAAAPSYLALESSLVQAATFTITSHTVAPNLVRNGGFEQRDLSGERGNLLGWQTFDLNSNPGSFGRWAPQTGSLSPLSLVSVIPPVERNFQAMLDEADLTPVVPGAPNPNAASTYAGAHALYQDITIPAGVTSAGLLLTLYIDNSGSGGFYSNTGATGLDFHGAPNQQVRVDVLTPSGDVLSNAGVLLNVFSTSPNDAPVQLVQLGTDLSAYKGQTVRLRIAAANNMGKLIVGVDNVRLNVQYTDTTAPTLASVGLRNPGFSVVTGGVAVPQTTDPTITGRVNDDGSINNLAYIKFIVDGVGNFKTTVWDAAGNFSFTPTGLTPGQHTVVVQAVDKAGNVGSSNFTFVLETNSLSEWRAVGPGPIDVTNQGVDYTTVSGRVTMVVADPTDGSGNTYYVGSANGGVWKTTDGGSSWAPLMDQLTDGSGNSVSAPIGALGVGVSSTGTAVLYAGTGVADTAFDSRPGVGIFKSADGGHTWALVGNSGTVLAGASISKIVVSSSDQNLVYAAVASGGQGPGVYRSADGGVTWVNVMTPASMGLPAGTALASVTDLIIDPFNAGRLIAGLGNVGLVATSGTAGLWVSTDGTGSSWSRPLGGFGGVPNSTLPNGAGVGKVLVAISSNLVGSAPVAYVLMGTPPGNNTPPNVNLGTFAGLYKTGNNFADFTKVMLRQDTSAGATHNFTDINLLGGDASYTGALAVDPTDPNAVYVGGSPLYAPAGSGPSHALVRIDTGDMAGPGSATNNGDDLKKATQAAAQGNQYAAGDPYTGEGVSWYDVIQRAADSTGTGTSLPPEIHALAFDPQGRLLIGTEGGLWRGVTKGYGYDFTSAGRGILGGKGFAAAGVTLTSLNGNLQIADLTSVAIDPTKRGVFYTTQAGTGGAASSGLLQWGSEGLTGPTVPGTGNLGIPTAGTVVAAPPAPNAPAGTPATLFRVWQYANQLAAMPEISTDGGKTWSTGAHTGDLLVGPNNPAAQFPALALNPNLLLQGGVYLDELLFGTSLVFHTANSGNTWDAVPGSSAANPSSPTPLSSTGGRITALALAPSGGGVFYAGTDKGELFVTFNGGAGGWLLRNTGLPAAKVNGITVDPINPNSAWLLSAAGGTASVWHTTNGGQTWANVTHNLPPGAAYALVIDPRTTGGAANGHIYVATDVGVFVSLDGAATWQRLGLGLPNVPVVGLQLNTNLETLAAATQGRGVFTISTDLIGPRVVGIGSTVGVPAVQLTFNESINPATLTPSALTLTGPGGTIPTAQLTVTDLNPGTDTVFSIGFSPGNLSGFYTLTLQPTVTDTSGNKMDQNQNTVNGEVPGDVYSGRFLYQSDSPNHAPVLGVTATTLPTVNENAFTNPGIDMASFVAGLAITDPDDFAYAPRGAQRGIAITGVDDTNGMWQFSTDGGATWTNIPSASDSAARVLEATPQNRIRFVPSPNFFGNPNPTFTYRAWDLTSGLNPANGADGGVASAIPNGGSSAYSSAAGTATVVVQHVNQPPSFTPGPNPSVLEDAGPQTVTNWATNITPGPNESNQQVTFIVTAANPAQFAVQPAISPSGTLTYTTAPNVFGPAVVTVQAHDNGGTANGGQDTSAPVQFTINIVQVNDAPSFTAGPNVSVGRDAGSVTIPGWAKNVSAGPNESAQALNFIVIGNSNPGLFNVQPAVAPDGTLTFTPSTVAGTAVVTLVLHDNGGTANGGQDTSAPQTFTITVSGLGFHGSPNEVWVSEAYLDLLNRPVDAGALVFWTDQIEQQGVSRTTIGQMLLNSAEYRTKLIQGLFQNLLGRPASANDVKTYLNFMAGGGTIEQMKAQFLSSHEYMVHRGVTTPASWVNAMYLDVFGHTASQDGINYWLAYSGQHGLAAAALGILTSPEASGTIVRHLYENLLGREPNSNAEGVNSWYVELQSGARDEDVTAGIAASDEYFTRLQPNWNDEAQLRNWVGGLYQDLLGRQVDAGGLGVWVNALHHGLPRVFITDQIVGSLEYQVHEINQLYQQFLRRPADSNGMALAQQTLNSGGTLDQVRAMLLGSSEYYFARGGGTDFGFLDAMYRDVLGRPIDDAGVSFWGGQLAAGVDRQTLALQFLGTTDAEKAKAQAYYLQTLHRSADPAGQAYWAGQLQAGESDALVLAALAATREYFSRFPNHT